MIIDIINCKGNREEIIEAAQFYAEILLHKRTAEVIYLTIEFQDDLDVEGEVYVMDGYYRPRDFQINIRGRPDDDDVIKTLAHEMVHVKQYVKKELGHSTLAMKGSKITDTSIWMGKPHKFKPKEDNYYDSPWEIEAFGREVGLYRRWTEYKRVGSKGI